MPNPRREDPFTPVRMEGLPGSVHMGAFDTPMRSARTR